MDGGASTSTEEEAVRALTAIGRQMEDADLPLHAIKCFDAAMRSRVLHERERMALGVYLGELLVHHTDSDDKAKSILTASSSYFRQHAAQQPIWAARCQLALACLHARKHERKLRHICLSSALSNSHSARSTCWALACRLRLAQMYAESEEYQNAIAELRSASSECTSSGSDAASTSTVLFNMALIMLRSGDTQSAIEALQECKSVCSSIDRFNMTGNAHLSCKKLLALCTVLQSLLARPRDVDDTALARVVEELVRAEATGTEQSTEEESSAPAYEHYSRVVDLPSTRSIHTLLDLVRGALGWPLAEKDREQSASNENGNSSNSTAIFQACNKKLRDVIQSSRNEFESFGLSSRSGCRSLTPRTRQFVSLTLHTAFYGIEAMLHSALTTFEVENAQRLLLQAHNLQKRFEPELSDCKPHVHHMASLYLLLCGEKQAAQWHASAAHEHLEGAGRRGRLAAVQFAMALMANRNIKKAAMVLAEQVSEVHGKRSSDEKAMVVLADGILKLCQGMQHDAKRRFNSALSMARNTMRSTQLLAQCMLLIGSMAVRNDTKAAMENLQASLQLAREIGALQTVVAAAERMSEHDTTCGGRGEQYAQKKRKRYDEVRCSATNSNEHERIVHLGNESFRTSK